MSPRDLQQLIQAAATSKSDLDYQKLFAALRGAEVYFNLDTSRPEGQAAPVTIPSFNVGGLNVFAVFVGQDNPRLTIPFGGLSWKGALEMLMQIPEADGLLIEGADLYWVVIGKSTA